MADKSVTVGFAYNGVGSPPTWDFDPDTVQMPQGPDTLTWTLSASGLPTGWSARFDQSAGITFGQNANWPGTSPAPVSGNPQQYSCSENNANANRAPIDYPYCSKVQVLDGNGAVHGTYTSDPQVENEGRGA